MDKIFKILADRSRRLILTLLKERPREVGEIVEKMVIGQATVSAHLAKMKKADLVIVEIKRKNRIYKINAEVWNSFIKEINRFGSETAPYLSDEIILRRKM
ncbi:MAG: metalloregulator ArsR/SmtB family transcription factor [Candidatus Shapirobacteria bacterium]|jgi:DNA-binding transcriptional ArsR family regulator